MKSDSKNNLSPAIKDASALYKKDRSQFFIFLVPLLFLLIFLIYPLVITLFRAFMPSGIELKLSEFTVSGFKKFFTSKLYMTSMKNSLISSLSVTLGTLLIGVPMGYFVARVKIPGKKLMLSLGILPMIMPSFIGAFSWVILLGNKGIMRYFFNFLLSPFGITLPSIYGMFGMIFCMVLSYYPFVFLLAEGAFSGANNLLEDAGMLMGAKKGRIFRTITLPLILPSLGASALLVFIRAIGNFGIPAMIGGDQYVLPTLIYFRVNGFADYNGASTIAVVNCIITGIILYAQKRMVKSREYETISATHTEIRQHTNMAARILAFIFCLLVLVLSLAPQITIIIMSFFEKWYGLFPEGFTLNNYKVIPKTSGHEFFNSFYLSTAATVLSAFLGSIMAYITERKRPKGAGIIDMAIMIPFILPGTVVSVALISAFTGNTFISIGGTYTIIIISYMIRRTPYTYRSVCASLTQLNPSLEEASTIAGATWFYTFRKVSVPLILPGIISGAILTFTTLLQELSTTILLYGPKTRTVPVQIYVAVAEGTLGEASALSTILLIVVFLVVYGTNKIRGLRMSNSFKM
ncbi:iron ABC transporter permease [Treponema parvum]|uniref:Iron ABC transporter permease n=1 Tax=Treponema parvum TaxID=138851 RepID=A0A975F1V8_9SPIR|nr:iron ABC transporter permease [Treponema parvum]QTQ12760.1 iron ABC transporter permease [Treponema parvum]